MLAMGRALMGKPRLLMLDEPSLGLAPLMVREIFNIVGELRSTGVSILLVEQNARAALQISDYGYVLETGDLALEGPSAELAANPRVAATYLGKGAAVAVIGVRALPRRYNASGPRSASHWKESLDRPLRSSRQQRPAGRSPAPAARARGPRRHRALRRPRVDPHARRRFRRPLLPVFADGELEPRGGHRQGGLVQHRPRRRHPRRARREAGLRVFRRHLARRAERSGDGRAGDRPAGAVRGRGARQASAAPIRCTRRPIRSHRCRTKPRSPCWNASSGWRGSATRAWRR